jgi:putative glycosyltransferase (TIGR04372 family)
MGAIVESPMPTSNPMIIDYASNGMRSEFLDIFLGAHCAFCISSGTGFDAIPYMFRRPIAYVNVVPVGICMTFSNRFTLLFKDHYDISTGLRMSLRSIFSADVAFSTNALDFRQKNIELRQNSSGQIQEAVVEMMDSLEGNLVDTKSSQAAQLRFRELFESLVATSEIAQHGQFKARYSAQELQKDPNWLM